MRKLLVKLVALETAVLGWLTYWLFLIYANNPAVSEGLLNELKGFPQVSYTTIDISIIVIIAVFSVVIALKFDRGLRPGMKLERALHMLESLMKRNLFLEAQLAEIRVDKPATGMITQTTVITPPQLSASTGPASNDLLRPSSWEKAFRIPIEAGPPSTIPSPSPSPVTAQTFRPTIESPQNEVRALPLQSSSSDRREDRPLQRPPPQVEAQKWEDSPRKTLETRGIISTLQQPPRRPLVPMSPPPTPSSSGRQPYIPMPAPKTPPVSVITSAVSQTPPIQQVIPRPSTPQPNTLKPGVPAQARPTSKFTAPQAQNTGRLTVPSQGNTQSPSIGQLFQSPKPPAPLVALQTSQKPTPLTPTQTNSKTLDKRIAKEEDEEDDLKVDDNDNENEKAADKLDDSDEEEDAASLDDDSE